ncbi:MAG: glycosyltransferase [Bryobacteraceae bacterium]
MRKPRVHLALPSFWPQDAVGNDVLGMRAWLQEAGYEATIFATWMDPRYEGCAQVLNPNASIWRCPDDILVYHHAIYWEAGERLLERAKTKTAIRYHNVTPPHFFKSYSQHYYDACTSGLAASERLARQGGVHFWGDSQFNLEDLIRFGAPRDRCRVLPPMHRIEEELASAPFDSVVAGDYRKARPSILFVGGIRPNKGHRKAIEAFAGYRRISDAPSRLVFVGRFDSSLNKYLEEIRAYAEECRVAAGVRFVFSATPAQLRAYYLTSSVFLCTSEHEGFCVPLVEAMFFRTPIVAWQTTAIGETCGPAGLLFREFSAEALAGAIDECVENPAIARQLADRGRAQYESRFHRCAIGARLLELVRELEQL